MANAPSVSELQLALELDKVSYCIELQSLLRNINRQKEVVLNHHGEDRITVRSGDGPEEKKTMKHKPNPSWWKVEVML